MVWQFGVGSYSAYIPAKARAVSKKSEFFK
jgi:HSP90 family molecular chaperone